MCISDLNKFVNSEEKYDLRPCSQGQIELFKEFLKNIGLIDIDVKGYKFTWFSNMKDGFVTMERINRFVANWE